MADDKGTRTFTVVLGSRDVYGALYDREDVKVALLAPGFLSVVSVEEETGDA